jgi:hypothetical protein
MLTGGGVHEAQRLDTVGRQHLAVVRELQVPGRAPAHPRGQRPAADLGDIVGDGGLRSMRPVLGQPETRSAIRAARVVRHLHSDDPGQRCSEPNRQQRGVEDRAAVVNPALGCIHR